MGNQQKHIKEEILWVSEDKMFEVMYSTSTLFHNRHSEKDIKRVRKFFNRDNVYRQLKTMVSFLIPHRSDVKLILNIGGGSYTDGNSITVGLPDLFIGRSYEEIFTALRALVGHEAQHVNSSDFPAFKKYREDVVDYFANKYPPLSSHVGRKYLNKVAHHFGNSVEDGRIEKILGQKLAGYIKYLKFLNISIWEAQPIQGNSEMEDFLYSVTSYCVTGLEPKDFKKFYKDTEVEENLNKIKPMILDGIEARTCQNCLDQTFDIIKAVEPYLVKLLTERTEETEDFLNNMDDSDEFTTSEETEHNNQPSSADTHFKPRKQKQQQEQQDEQQQEQQQEKQSGEEEDEQKASKQKKQKKKEKQDGESEDEQTEQNSGGSESDSDEEKENESEDEEGSGSGSSEDEEESEDEQEGKSGSSDDSTEDAENDESDDQAGGKGEDDSEEDSDSENADGEGEGEDSENSEDESDGDSSDKDSENESDGDNQDGEKDDSESDSDSDDSSDNDSADGESSDDDSSSDNESDSSQREEDDEDKQADHNPSGMEDKGEDEVDEDEVSAFLEELTKEVTEDAEEKIQQKKEDIKKQKLKEDDFKLNEEELRELEAFYRNDMNKHFRQVEDLQLRYQLPAEIKREGNRFRKEVERIFRNKEEYTLRGQRKGILDVGNLHRFQTKEYNLFVKKGVPIKSDYVAYLLEDGSGSMSERGKWQESKRALSVMEEGLKGIIPFKVTTFNTDWGGNSVVHQTVKDFNEENKAYNYSYNSLMQRRPQGGNKDGYSIRVATKELLKRPEKDRILIIFSDGLPSNYNGGKKAGMVDVKNAIKEARKAGIFVVALLFGTEEFRDLNIESYKYMYEKNIISCEPNLISNHLTRMLKKIISH